MAAAQFPLAVAQNSRTIFVILITALLVLYYQVWATSARFLRVVWVQPKTLGQIANDSNKSWLWQKAQGTGSPGQIEARIFLWNALHITLHITLHIRLNEKRWSAQHAGHPIAGGHGHRGHHWPSRRGVALLSQTHSTPAARINLRRDVHWDAKQVPSRLPERSLECRWNGQSTETFLYVFKAPTIYYDIFIAESKSMCRFWQLLSMPYCELGRWLSSILSSIRACA